MRGLYLGKNNSFLHQSKFNSAVLSLLAKNDGLEIMLQEILPYRPCGVTPGETPNLLEFFYVLQGSLLLSVDGEEIVLGQGEHFYVTGLQENVPIYSGAGGAKLLYVASQPLFDHLHSYQDELDKLLREAESKDVYTFNHGRRVQAWAVRISNKLGLSKDIIHALAVSSLFHDLGKINVPNAVLNKPSGLTSAEFELIKKHPLDSKLMLEGKFTEKVASIVEQHHERLDGSGYPSGLMGREILLEAKIIAVADSYDAMISDRAYRQGMRPREAVAQLQDLSGTHYDQDIVEALTSLLQEDKAL